MRRTKTMVAAAASALLLGSFAGPALHGEGAQTPAPHRDLDAVGSPLAAAPADPAIAAALKAVDAERIREIITKLVSFGTRDTLTSMSTDLPPGQGILPAADWIEGRFREISASCGGCLEVKRDTFIEQPPATITRTTRIPYPTKISNVYAILRGTDPTAAKRMYLVSGHYDSRNSDTLDTHKAAPGANDDASGVAVSLECARALVKLRPAATTVFITVAGEEEGLNGSTHLAKLAKAEGWDVRAMLDDDIVGGNRTPGDTLQDRSAVRVFSEGVPAAMTPVEAQQFERLGYGSDSPSRELARAIVGVAETYPIFVGSHPLMPRPTSTGIQARSQAEVAEYLHPVLIFRRDRFLRGGDHTPFNAEGFAAVRFTEWREDFNHQHQDVRIEPGPDGKPLQYGDLIQYVDMDYTADVAKLNAAALAVLASAPPEPADVKILTRALDNNSTLQWTAGAGAAAGQPIHYEIVWRAIDAPDWQYQASADNFGAKTATDGVFSATLPVSKDNVIFGVRAADAQEHRSAAVVPMPLAK